MTTYFDLLKSAINTLTPVSDTPEQDAETCLISASQRSKPWLFANLHEPIKNNQISDTFFAYISDYMSGKPLAYILGELWFYKHKYQTKEGVLIPRSETELLVEKAIQTLEKTEILKPAIFELGFGTGVISCEVALAYTQLNIQAWDINKNAVAIAEQNATNLNINNVTWHYQDFFKAEACWGPHVESATPTLILSNPPYIPTDIISTLDDSVKEFEPHNALDGGIDGLNYYKNLFELLPQFKNTTLILEIGFGQQAPLEKLLGQYTNITFEFTNDYHDIPRILCICC